MYLVCKPLYKNMKNFKYPMKEYTNDLTRELDEYVLFKTDFHTKTYIVKDIKSPLYFIRFLGGTRGHIEVNDSFEIVNIRFYQNAYENHVAVYKSEIENVWPKYIGMVLKFED